MPQPAHLGEQAGALPTRERILDAAESQFAAKGFSGTTVRDIAGDVGLNPASLYNHFPGKEDLYEAVLERGLQPILELLDGMTGPSALPDADVAVAAVVAQLSERPALARLLQHEALAGGDRLRRISGRWMTILYEKGIRALAEGSEGGPWDLDELPLLLIALQNSILGYFAMAPLLETVLGSDPLGDEHLQRMERVLAKMVRLLLGRDADTAGVPGTTPADS